MAPLGANKIFESINAMSIEEQMVVASALADSVITEEVGRRMKDYRERETGAYIALVGA